MSLKNTRRPIAGEDERADSEGMPDVAQDFPPGKDIETSEEASMLPRDHSVAAGSDSAYPVTAAEQERPEPVSARHARENPDIIEPSGGDAPVLTEEAGEAAAAPSAEPSTAPEEVALHVEDTLRRSPKVV